ncbi:MAG: urease accessory UreF family protein [Candidatus Competibacteraceae bacterium]
MKTTDGLPLLRLLQLVSPALPVGAYAYSQGLEQAVARAWVHDQASARDWILGLLAYPLSYQDVPVLARLYRALEADDRIGVCYWSTWLYACREAAELQREERHLGLALARLLTDLELVEAAPWREAERVCFATLFALAAVRWQIPLEQTAAGYLWAWLENQVAAATRLVPLGQTAGQQLLTQVQPAILTVIRQGLALTDDDL